MILATIFADDGTPLAEASLTWVDPQTIEIRRIFIGKGKLMEYIFGRGSRAVRLRDAGTDVRASLRTRWAGHERRWELVVHRRVAAEPAPRPEDRELIAAAAGR
jgi:hypothetical protein